MGEPKDPERVKLICGMISADSALMDQVELDIAATPIGLEVALALTEGHGLAALHDGHVSGQEGIADRAREGPKVGGDDESLSRDDNGEA